MHSHSHSRTADRVGQGKFVSWVGRRPAQKPYRAVHSGRGREASVCSPPSRTPFSRSIPTRIGRCCRAVGASRGWRARRASEGSRRVRSSGLAGRAACRSRQDSWRSLWWGVVAEPIVAALTFFQLLSANGTCSPTHWTSSSPARSRIRAAADGGCRVRVHAELSTGLLAHGSDPQGPIRTRVAHAAPLRHNSKAVSARRSGVNGSSRSPPSAPAPRSCSCFRPVIRPRRSPHRRRRAHSERLTGDPLRIRLPMFLSHHRGAAMVRLPERRTPIDLNPERSGASSRSIWEPRDTGAVRRSGPVIGSVNITVDAILGLAYR